MTNGDKQRRRRRQEHARRSQLPLPPSFVRADAPPKRLPVLFQVMDDITRTADLTLASRDRPFTQDELFDTAVFVRANNLLKASNGLFAGGHWEVAASAARQLFELLVNLEYLLNQPDPAAERLRYAKFGLLQQTVSRLREVDYERSTGRPVNEEQASAIGELLDGPVFDEFKAKGTRWLRNWSGKSTKALAELSPARMRIKQYEQLFVAWSEETHAAPIALLEDILPKEMQGWVERQIAKDDREIGQMVLMLVVLFIELWRILPGAPVLDAEVALRWTTPLYDEAMARTVLKPHG